MSFHVLIGDYPIIGYGSLWKACARLYCTCTALWTSFLLISTHRVFLYLYINSYLKDLFLFLCEVVCLWKGRLYSLVHLLRLL